MSTVAPVSACDPDQLAALFAGGGWPAFIDADRAAAVVLPQVRETFGGHELALSDGGEVVAAGWGVPVVWSGAVGDLPSGYTASLERALDDDRHGRTCDTFVLCAIQVHAAHAGRSLAARMLAAFTDHAAERGLRHVIAPLRPTLKHRYPLTPIQEYAGWTRDDGQAFDPWLRLHRRAGAQVLSTSDTSQTFTGTVAQWQEWSGLSLPGSGRYVIPDALAPLTLDHDADLGTLTEPGIWVQHR